MIKYLNTNQETAAQTGSLACPRQGFVVRLVSVRTYIQQVLLNKEVVI